MRVRLLFLFLLLPFLFVLSRSRRPLVFVFAIHHILERDEGRRCQHLARQAIETMYLPSLSFKIRLEGSITCLENKAAIRGAFRYRSRSYVVRTFGGIEEPILFVCVVDARLLVLIVAFIGW